MLATLDGIEAQAYAGKLGVLLIDDGSTNGIQGPLSEWLARTHRYAYRSMVLDGNSGSKGRALDRALPFVGASAEVLMIVDSDTRLSADALSRLVGRLWSDPLCAVACGYLVPSNPQGSIWCRLQACEYTAVLGAAKIAQDHLGCVPVMAGAFIAHRRTVVDELGGWGHWLVEDMAWTWNALAHGYRSAYVTGAVAFTQCPETWSALRRQRRRWARGRIEAYKALSSASRWRGSLMFPLLAHHVLRQSTVGYLPLTLMAMVREPLVTTAVIVSWSILYMSVLAAHRWRSRNPTGQRWTDVPLSFAMNRGLVLALWWPGFRGLLDEVLCVRHAWLTRGTTTGRPSQRTGDPGTKEGLPRSSGKS